MSTINISNCISGIIVRSILFSLLILLPIDELLAKTFDSRVDESIDYLLEQNREFKKDKADRKSAGLNVREARSAVFPSISLDGNYSYLGNIQSFEFDTDGPEGDPPSNLKAASENMFKGTLSLHQSLFSGSVFGAIKVAKSYQAAAENQLIGQQNSLIRDYLTSYGQVIMLADFVEVNREMVDYTKSHFEEAKLLYGIGAVDNYTLLRAEVDHLNSIPSFKDSEKAYKAAISGLKLMLNLNENDKMVLHEFDVELEMTDNWDELTQKAKNNRPEIEAMRYIARAYEQAIGIYNSERIPTLSGFGNFSVENQWDMFSQKENWNESWVVGLNLSVPIFSGFRISSRIQKSKLDYNRARQDESILTDGILIELQIAYDDYLRSNSDFDAWFRNVELANEGFKIAKLRWTNGNGSELELRDARIALKSAQANLSAAKFDLLQTKILLVYAIGEIDNIVIIENEKKLP